MWSGSVATIPTGWVLCNGSNGTPDLRNRFIIGAHSDTAGVAYTTITGSNTQTGGSKDAIVVSHTHTGTTNSDGTHSHTANSGLTDLDQGTFGGGRSSVVTTLTTNSAGAHTHSFTTASTGDSGTNANLPPYYALAFIMKT
jgi:microcystin-dependent protein